ncbi:MAG: hypothetical protein EOL97_07115 [Spirochaetia bacterium]|nr:hypothetical protein [Spirochaetia bacterium]
MVEIDDNELDDWGLTAEEIEEFEAMQGMEGEYSKKSDFSKALLSMTCTQKVFDLRAREMKKGYYNYKYLPDGNELKMWVPDTRKEYISSVKALNILLVPEVSNYKDNAMKIAELKKQEDAIYKVFAYDEIYLDSNGDAVRTGVSFMPENDTELLIDTGNGYVKNVGAWDLKLEHYWNKLVDIYDQIFEQLSIVMHSCNYFKGKIRVG